MPSMALEQRPVGGMGLVGMREEYVRPQEIVGGKERDQGLETYDWNECCSTDPIKITYRRVEC